MLISLEEVGVGEEQERGGEIHNMQKKTVVI